MLYYGFILVCMALIALFNYLFAAPVFGFDFGFIALAVVISTVGVVVIDLILAGIVRWILPGAWFSPDKKGFAAGKRERRFYERLGIKKWKDKVPEWGKLTGFSKSRIAEPSNNLFIARYIQEANYGIGVHIACIIGGFAVIFIYMRYWLCFGLWIGLINAAYNAISLFILRYNLPKLHTLYAINERREKRRQAAAGEKPVPAETAAGRENPPENTPADSVKETAAATDAEGGTGTGSGR